VSLDSESFQFVVVVLTITEDAGCLSILLGLGLSLILKHGYNHEGTRTLLGGHVQREIEGDLLATRKPNQHGKP
jgi:hypothetical protein